MGGRLEAKGAPMDILNPAIGLIVLFIVVIAALNRYEFGRFD